MHGRQLEMATTSKTTLADWLAAEPFHLSLSSSFFGMPCHAGFLQALLDAGLEPASVAGSSAGALVGTLWAAGLSVETMKSALEAAFAESADVLRVAVPWRRDGLPPEFGGVFSSAATKRVVQSILEAHPRAATHLEHCRVPAAVSVFDVGRLKTVVVREGPISDALSATMCVPGMFAPSVLADGRVALDGGVGDLSGLRALDHDARTLYHHCSVAPLSSTRAPAYRRAVAVNIAGLPFLHPLNIERRGESSYDASRQATRALLRRPRAVDNEARGRVQYLRARARL